MMPFSAFAYFSSSFSETSPPSFLVLYRLAGRLLHASLPGRSISTKPPSVTLKFKTIFLSLISSQNGFINDQETSSLIRSFRSSTMHTLRPLSSMMLRRERAEEEELLLFPFQMSAAAAASAPSILLPAADIGGHCQPGESLPSERLLLLGRLNRRWERWKPPRERKEREQSLAKFLLLP